MNSQEFQIGIKHYATKAIGQSNINATSLRNYNIPLPPLEIQQQIVDQIEAERTLVESAKKLIQIYEQKTKTTLTKLWEE
jgi:restriction endonuclease S subunit